MSKQIYLDVCALCRPFDDQRQARIQLETNAVELILAHIRQQTLAMIVSPVHAVEIRAIADTEERSQLLLLIGELGMRSEFDLLAARIQAEQLVKLGIGLGDAAHLAFARQANADFVSVDDRLLKQCQRANLPIWSGSPLVFCEKEGLQ